MNPTNKIIKDLEGSEYDVTSAIKSYTNILEKKGFIKVNPEVWKKQKRILVYGKEEVEQSLNNYFKNKEKEIDEEKITDNITVGRQMYNKGLQKAKEMMFGNKE